MNYRMSDIKCRTAQPDDVPEMVDLFLTTLGDLYTRNNITAVMPQPEVMILEYEHVLSTGIFNVAESQGQIIAIAGAIIRDHLWYLSAFWVHPEFQCKKIGLPLLRHIWKEGAHKNATIFFTWSSIDLTAITIYLRLGVFPYYEILVFEGKPTLLPIISHIFKTVPLEKQTEMELDNEVLSFRREVDHNYWLKCIKMQGRQVLWNGKTIGYFYTNKGNIGPVVWNNPHWADILIILAFNEVARTGNKILISIPGINHSALRIAINSGLRLTRYAHFMSTSDFAHMRQYIPSGPSLY